MDRATTHSLFSGNGLAMDWGSDDRRYGLDLEYSGGEYGMPSYARSIIGSSLPPLQQQTSVADKRESSYWYNGNSKNRFFDNASDYNKMLSITDIRNFAKQIVRRHNISDDIAIDAIEKITTNIQNVITEALNDDHKILLIDTQRISNKFPEDTTSTNRLPELPDGLHWPSVSYSDALSESSVRNIIQFLELHWLSLIAQGFGELRWLRAVDPSAVEGIKNYQKKNKKTGEQRLLPPHLRFLTMKEVNNRELLTGGPEAVRGNRRLANALAYRLERGLDMP